MVVALNDVLFLDDEAKAEKDYWDSSHILFM